MSGKGMSAVGDFAYLSIVDAFAVKGMPAVEDFGINALNSAVYNVIVDDILKMIDPYLIIIDPKIAQHLKKIVFMTVMELIARKVVDGNMKTSRVVIKHLVAQLISYIVQHIVPTQVISS